MLSQKSGHFRWDQTMDWRHIWRGTFVSDPPEDRRGALPDPQVYMHFPHRVTSHGQKLFSKGLGTQHMWLIRANISFLIPLIPWKEQISKTMAILSNFISSPMVLTAPEPGRRWPAGTVARCGWQGLLLPSERRWDTVSRGHAYSQSNTDAHTGLFRLLPLRFQATAVVQPPLIMRKLLSGPTDSPTSSSKMHSFSLAL